jgi:hypothetical protein
MVVNHLTMEDASVQEGGRVEYVILIDRPKAATDKAVFPGVRRMKRLARKFLRSEYEERKGQRINDLVFFNIKSGTTPEDRAAFLAAVALYTKFVAK